MSELLAKRTPLYQATVPLSNCCLPPVQTLVEATLAQLFPVLPPVVLPEYRLGGVGRPDLAFARANQPARSFIELKEPRKLLDPRQLRGHDANQFKRFSELPLWGFSNFISLHLYRRGDLLEQVEVVPALALDPATTSQRAEALIRGQDHQGFQRVIEALALAEPPQPANAEAIAQVLAYAARLVREVISAQCSIGLNGVLSDVKAEFNDTLFARPEAGGYDPGDGNELFASAFSQTLIFGLLIAREAGGGQDVTANAYQLLPVGTYPLLRGTLRALTLDEVRDTLGVAFDVALDAANSVSTDLLVPIAGRDPVLYLYEDFLRVFDPAAVTRYGVYYTPPEVVQFIVAEADSALRDGLGSDGLLDPAVSLLDPACGTGTFLISAANAVAETATARYGAGMVGPEVAAFAQRMYGFELLVGPYTVAHYRMLRTVAGHGGAVARLPIYLADTLSPPAGAAGAAPHLAFMGAPMVAEREAADAVKRDTPILAIIGNPPYRRLRGGEIARLVGADMNQRWDDLKRPVRDAGFPLSLNAFPDLYVAFYRWALWKLFEADGATERGVLAYITNRGFLTSRGFGGLRLMLRRKFHKIRVIDLRGNNAGVRPAHVLRDQNVFNIEVGVCVLVAYATGPKPIGGEEAEVSYADVWVEQAFTRHEKLQLAAAAARNPHLLQSTVVVGSGMSRMKPVGFLDRDWPGLDEILSFRSNGIVTYRDDFVYATTRDALQARIKRWLGLAIDQARSEFFDSTLNKAGRAILVPFDPDCIERISYRPFDDRFLYSKPQYVDRLRDDLQNAWGPENFCLIAKSDGTGAGPSVWCYSRKPDQHSFRGSFGGWIFPLQNHAGEGAGSFFAPGLLGGLATAYGRMISAQEAFDAILALLSATSYSLRFSRDLEDDFPHVPFPADPNDFAEASRIGSHLRTIQGFGSTPDGALRSARLVGAATNPVLNVPTPRRAYVINAAGVGEIGLLPDRSLRITGVSERVWAFSVSGYSVLYRWLRARSGEVLDGQLGATLLRSALDVVWRIEELVSLCDDADVVLRRTLQAPLARGDLGLPPRDLGAAVLEGEEDAPN